MSIKLYKYTKSELDKLLKSIVVLVDTREKQNKHITDFFDKHKIEYKRATLSYADYSFYLPKNDDLGIVRDLYFDNLIAVERKGSLEELSGNLAQNRQRFEDELLRASARITLMVENASYDDIYGKKYKTKLSEKAFAASIATFKHRYNMDVQFISKENAGKFIYTEFYYWLREYLK